MGPRDHQRPPPVDRRACPPARSAPHALDNALRGAIFEALRAADVDADVRVTVIRGAGSCFSTGYDLSADLAADRPYETAGGDGHWPWHVVEGWFAIWDLGRALKERATPFGDYRGRGRQGGSGA